MTNIQIVNRLLPPGFYAEFEDAEDPSVNPEYAIYDPQGKPTNVSIGIDIYGPCVTRWFEGKGELLVMTPRDWDQTAALKADIIRALECEC